MKKAITCLLCWVLILTLLGGCGSQQEAITDSSSSEEEIVFGDLDALAIADLEGKDNSKDAYSAIVNTHMKTEEPEGALPAGAIEYALGVSKAYYLQNHYFEEHEKDWGELVCASADGTSVTLKKDNENAIYEIYPVVGTNHYLVSNSEYQKDESGFVLGYELSFQEYDEEHQLVREISAPYVTVNMDVYVKMHSSAIMDNEGKVHYILNKNDDAAGIHSTTYLVISSTGELLAEYTPDEYMITRLIPLYDGSVACLEEKIYTEGHENTDYRIEYVDEESGEATVILEWTEPFGKHYELMTLWDEDTRLYADKEGLYVSDLNGENEQILYRWISHGITISHILALQVLPEQRIGLLYWSGGEPYYMCLEPTGEQVELREIVLAVSPGTEGIYREAVVEFNKKYPTCQVELKSDYDKTTLLTELTAGNGPVLVDTSLTGFENQKKLWEPLDKIFEELDIMKDLQPSAMELGRIDGTLYGVITNFWLETVVTGNRELETWDYDTFLKCITEQPDLKAILNKQATDSDAGYFMSSFFIHGLDDNYFIDAEKGKTNFDSDEFRTLVRAAKKYCVRNDMVPPVEMLSTGEVLCNPLIVQKPQQLALYRTCYGEDINYIGYPGKDGSGHYLNSRLPLTIRKTASKEEKELAVAFLAMLLSYECQVKFADEVNFYLSTRSDVLDAQINSVNEETGVYAFGFETSVVGDNVDNDRDAETLYSLIDNAKPHKTFPNELNAIIFDELEEYFTDAITEDVLIERLENRVKLYLDENN